VIQWTGVISTLHVQCHFNLAPTWSDYGLVAKPQDVLYLRARDFLRHIGLSPVCVPRQPVGSGYRALDPAGFMVLSEVETSLALIMGLESSGIPL
jgi:hypothetical protein